VRILEYHGIDASAPFDIGAGATGTSATSTSPAVTTTTPTELLVAANYVATVTTGPGTGYTSRGITNPDADIVEDKVVTAAGSYTATAAMSASGWWIMQLVAFKAAGSAPPPPDTTPPTAPTNLAAVAASSAQVNLTWTAATDNVGVTGYFVDRCAGVGCSNFAQIATPAGASYPATRLTPGTGHTYPAPPTHAPGNPAPSPPT